MLKKLSLILLCASSLALAAPGSVTRATDLKDKPFLDAATVARLPAGSAVDIQQRQGAWAQVRSADGRTGWVKILNLRSGATSGSALGGVNQALNVARTGSSGNTVTTGVKGLSAEQIRNATPNPQEVERMKTYAVTSAQAQQFARNSRLNARSVADISMPSSTTQQPLTSD